MEVAALIVATIATITDTKSRRIPNWLTLPVLAGALAFRLWWGGPEALGQGALGAGLALGLMAIPFVTGGIGAGDVKLFVALGALLGPLHAVRIVAIASLLGVAMALGIVVKAHGREALAVVGAGSVRGLMVLVAAGGQKQAFPFGAFVWCGVVGTLLWGA